MIPNEKEKKQWLSDKTAENLIEKIPFIILALMIGLGFMWSRCH